MNLFRLKKNFSLHSFFLVFICFISWSMIACAQGITVDKLGVSLVQNNAKPNKYKELIIIDPGHGGSDIGAVVQSVKEKTLALQTATLVKKYLHDKGYRVILTRSRDVFISLKRRTQIANDTRSKLFISIHFNAFKETNIKGIEIYYYNKGLNSRQHASKQLAHIILDSLIKATGTHSRGVKTGNFHVIRETNMPAILIEGGFITNYQERNQLRSKKYIEKMAHSIANGIDKYFQS